MFDIIVITHLVIIIIIIIENFYLGTLSPTQSHSALQQIKKRKKEHINTYTKARISGIIIR